MHASVAACICSFVLLVPHTACAESYQTASDHFVAPKRMRPCYLLPTNGLGPPLLAGARFCFCTGNLPPDHAAVVVVSGSRTKHSVIALVVLAVTVLVGAPAVSSKCDMAE